MVENKARKIRKTKKPRKKASKAPLYVLIVAVVIIFSLLGIGIFYSLDVVNPNLLLMLVVIIVATIFIEIILKRSVYPGTREERIDPEEDAEAVIKEDSTEQEKPEVKP